MGQSNIHSGYLVGESDAMPNFENLLWTLKTISSQKKNTKCPLIPGTPKLQQCIEFFKNQSKYDKKGPLPGRKRGGSEYF